MASDSSGWWQSMVTMTADGGRQLTRSMEKEKLMRRRKVAGRDKIKRKIWDKIKPI